MHFHQVRHLTAGAAALLLALVAAPAAPAAQAGKAEASRDTGVGAQIAAQGDRALDRIRAEAAAAVRAALPRLPADGRVVELSQPAAPAGAIVATGPDVQCAE